MSNLNVNESNPFKMNSFTPIHNFEFKEKIVYKPTINYPIKSNRDNIDKKEIINSNENKNEKYWEKRAKENLEKMQKIKNEQDYREFGELKNKPTISQESIYIAKKLSEDIKKNDTIDRNKNENENAAEYYNKKNMENLRKIEKYELIKKFKEQMLKEVENYNHQILLSEPMSYNNNPQKNYKNINLENSNNKFNNNQNYFNKAGTNYSTYPFFSNKQMIYTMNTNPIKLTDRNDICFRNKSSKNKKSIKKIEKQEEQKIGNDGEINVEEAVKKNELNVEDIKPMEINETDFKKFFGENGNLDNYNINNNPKLKNTKTVTFLEPMNTTFTQNKSNALLLSRKASKKTFLSKYDLKNELDIKSGSVTKMISNVSSINEFNIQSKFNSNSSSKRSSKQLEKKPSNIHPKSQSKQNSHTPSRQMSSTQSFKSSKSNVNKSKLESNNIGIMYKNNNTNKSKINESLHSNKSKGNKSKISNNNNKEDSSHSNNVNNNKSNIVNQSNESNQSKVNHSKINDSKNSNIKNSKSNLSSKSIIESEKNDESSSNLNSSTIKQKSSIESKKNTINGTIESNKKDFIKIEESSPVKSKLNESYVSGKNKSKIEEDNVVVLKKDNSKKTINKSNSNNNSNVKPIKKKSSLRSNKNTKSLKTDLDVNKKSSKKLTIKNSLNSLKENENENYVELNPMESLKKNKYNYTEYNNNEINNNDNIIADVVISKIQDNQEKNIQIKNDIFQKFEQDINENDPWINFREENNKRLQDLNNFKNELIEFEPEKLPDEAKKAISKSMKLKVTNNFINGEYTSYDNKIDYLNQKLDINNEKKKNLLSQF